MDMGLSKDLTEDRHAGHAAEGNTLAFELLEEQRFSQNISGDSVEEGESLLLDIAGTVSVTDDVDVGEVKCATEDGRTNLITSNVTSTNVVSAVVGVGSNRGETVGNIFSGADEHCIESNVVLTKTDNLREVGRVLVGILLTDSIVKDIVTADRNVVREVLTMGPDSDAGLAEVLFREASIQRVTNHFNCSGRNCFSSGRRVISTSSLNSGQLCSSQAVSITILQRDGGLDVEIDHHSFTFS